MVFRIGVVGSAWRGAFFTRLATQLTSDFELVGITARRAEAVTQLEQTWRVPVSTDPVDLVRRSKPDLVVVAVPAASNLAVVRALTAAGAPVLTETPPATTIEGLRRYWQAVGETSLVQVAEQYLRLPAHAARLHLVKSGVIGSPTSVQVSSTHDYHAISLIRGFLGVGLAPAKVRAVQHSGLLLDPLNRDGWTGAVEPTAATNTIATLDFGGALGLYDFTDNQWHNRLRHRRIVIRGTHGEIVDDSVVHQNGPRSTLTSRMDRSQLGYDLNLDGYDTEHIHFEGDVVFENPFLGARLMDEEIAIASLMRDAGAWAVGAGPAPYPLREALQDSLLGLAMHEAATTGREICTTDEIWH